MPAQTREIKGRLASIKNTQKITKAMELVAGAKMRRAVEGTMASRFYAKLAWDLAQRLAKTGIIASTDYLADFFKPVENPNKITILMVTSNRGLAGAFNSNITKIVAKHIQEVGKENVEVVCLGKKGVPMLSSLGIKPVQAYDKDDSATDTSSIVTLSNYLYQQFKQGKTNQVLIAYTNFKSPLVQEPVLQTLYPFSEDLEAGEIEYKEAEEVESMPNGITDYYYEPGRRTVVSYLVPRLGESLIYQALLESNASEHSARMVAMKSATDAAEEMHADLQLAFNRARQASITQEVAEITAGTAAVS
jgi:F-type H+-transporting ATPase subunit gamma